MKNGDNWRSAVIAAVLALGLVTSVSVALAGPSSNVVVPPNSTAYGNKYSGWSAEWWQFVLSIPGPDNPLFDDNGSRCVIGQRGPVWFFVGWFGEGAATRTCSVPEGSALFFPIINVVDVNTTTQTAAELRAETAPCLDAVTSLSVALDGVPVPLNDKFRVQSEVFAVTLPADNLFGIDAGTYSPAIDDGFYVMLKPLSVGTHALHFKGASSGCPLIGGPFGVEVTYNLTVVPVSLK